MKSDAMNNLIAMGIAIAILFVILYLVFWKKEKFDGAKGEDPRLAWMRR
jgi:nitrogen fixation-related uncharacterized protein